MSARTFLDLIESPLPPHVPHPDGVPPHVSHPPGVPAAVAHPPGVPASVPVVDFPTTVSELLDSPGWDSFMGSKMSNDLFINDPERAARCYDAAEEGCDGSTHSEIIEDWREYAADLRSEKQSELYRMDFASDEEGDAAEAALEAAYETLCDAIDKVEAYHEAQGTLYDEVG